MGETVLDPEAGPLARIAPLDGPAKPDGAAAGNVWGSYVHGIFDRAESAQALVNALLAAKGLAPEAAAVDWESYQQQQYDRLAAGMRESLDMERIYRILDKEEREG